MQETVSHEEVLEVGRQRAEVMRLLVERVVVRLVDGGGGRGVVGRGDGRCRAKGEECAPTCVDEDGVAIAGIIDHASVDSLLGVGCLLASLAV